MTTALKKTILIISPFFYPEIISTGKYNTVLAESLLAEDFLVEVISSYPLYPDWKPQKTDDEIDGIKMYRGGSSIFYPGNFILRRLILEIWFSLFSLYSFFQIRKNVDLIIPVFPPSLFFLVISSFITAETKVVGIVHDLQGVYSGKSKKIFPILLTNLINTVESTVFKRCNHLIFLSNSMLDRAIKTHNLDQAQCSYSVHYPFSNISFSENDKDLDCNFIADLFPDPFVHVVYSGALGEKQNSNGLMNFFQSLTETLSNVRCHIFSGGPIFRSLKETKSSSTIFFHDLVPEKYLGKLYSYSDVHIIPQAPNTSDGSLPSKLPNLIQYGVPIFAICDENSELSKIISESKIGCSVHSWDTDILVSKFNDFMIFVKENNREYLRDIGEKYAISNFNISSLIDVISQF
jgi:colanic acid biosynthesis glycosyl transferase WcaI